MKNVDESVRLEVHNESDSALFKRVHNKRKSFRVVGPSIRYSQRRFFCGFATTFISSTTSFASNWVFSHDYGFSSKKPYRIITVCGRWKKV